MTETSERIDGIVKGNDIVLFMKGNPGAPQASAVITARPSAEPTW